MALGALFCPGMTNVLPAETATSMPIPMGRTGGTIRIVNPSSDRAVWVEFGGADVIAEVERSMLILPRTAVQWRLPRAATHIAALAEAGTTPPNKSPIQLNVTYGEGS